jgi:hypothetical protein
MMGFKQAKAKQLRNAAASQEEEQKQKLYNMYKQRAQELEKAAMLLEHVDGAKGRQTKFYLEAAECMERAAELLEEQCATSIERINELTAPEELKGVG